MYQIKSPNPSFSGARVAQVNAGPFKKIIFHEGLSHPVSDEVGEAFVKHFPNYELVKVEDESETPEKLNIEFVKEFNVGGKPKAPGDTGNYKASFAQELVDKGVAKVVS